MALELLVITGYKDEAFQQEVSGSPYTLMINPDSLHWNRVLAKNESVGTSQGQKGKVSTVNLKFDIIIDCTGIVDSTRIDLTSEIQNLESQLYTQKNSVYQSNFVKVEWGQNICFYSQLKSCHVSYTLFKPDGSPLRAKVSFVFEKQDLSKNIKKKKKSWFSFLLSI